MSKKNLTGMLKKVSEDLTQIRALYPNFTDIELDVAIKNVSDLIAEAEELPENFSCPISYIQMRKALRWLGKHEKHVNSLIQGITTAYPPTEESDLNTPELWKPEHWNWFNQTFLEK